MEEASTRLVLAVGGLAGEWVPPPPRASQPVATTSPTLHEPSLPASRR